jgi:RNA polymerase-binding transcription factor DksA
MVITPNEFARAYLSQKCSSLGERLARVDRDRQRGVTPLSADSEDRAQELENDEVLDHLSATLTRELSQVRRAMERLDAGRYGTCEYCGGPIGAARLQALPEATRCSLCINPRSLRSRPAYRSARV